MAGRLWMTLSCYVNCVFDATSQKAVSCKQQLRRWGLWAFVRGSYCWFCVAGLIVFSFRNYAASGDQHQGSALIELVSSH